MTDPRHLARVRTTMLEYAEGGEGVPAARARTAELLGVAAGLVRHVAGPLSAAKLLRELATGLDGQTH